MVDTKQKTPQRAYEDILRDSRQKQLKLMATAVRRLEVTFDAAAESIRQKIAALPEERIGTAWHRAQLRLLIDIYATMDALKADVTTLTEVGMLEQAQNAADREAAAAKLVSALPDENLFPNLSHTFTLSNRQDLTVEFGRLAFGAVERLTTRYYSDGLKLSDRIHRLDQRGRRVIEDVLTQSLIEQVSAQETAKRVRAALTAASADGIPPPRYVALRIARTELGHAHREAHVMSTQSSPGELKEYIAGVRWILSASHAEPDICDLYASHDSGLGPGVYLPSDVPVEHPNGLCPTTTVLKAFPDSGVGKLEPRAADVPPSQIAYAAAHGDAVAQAYIGAGA